MVQYIDSIINTNSALINYRALDYCDRIKYIDSVINVSDAQIFDSRITELLITNVCIKANVKPNFRKKKSELPIYGIAPFYTSKEEYFEVSKNCKRNLKCK